MALKPQKLSWVAAATVPLSAITAWQALFEHAGVKGFDDPSKKKVLVVAAAGGVGCLACAVGQDCRIRSCGAGRQCQE